MARSKSETSVIYLMGMPGCGKTTLGKKLAHKLGYSFVDLDDYIEEKEDDSISSIFEIHGENYFRKAEQDAVAKSTQWNQTVVACGGGAPCFFDNMEVMNQAGTTLFIDVSVNELMKRIYGKGQNKRPILSGKSEIELKTELEQKVSHRKQFFNQADITISSDKVTLEDLLKLLNSKTLGDNL